MIRYMTLGDVCTDIIDCPHESPNWKSEGVAVIRNFNLVNGRIDMQDGYYVDEDTYLRRTRRAVPSEGDIIFSREAPIGNCAIVPKDFKCCLGQRLVLLRVNHAICSSEYLLAVLQSSYVKQQIEQVSKRGSIVSNFAIGDLHELVVPVLDNQNEIAVFSNAVSEKIAINNAICSNLEAVAKLLYDYWFVQFDFPDENGKPYKSSGGKMVWNDDLKREIPAGWEAKPLRGLYNIERGLSYSSDDIATGNGVPMINLACIDRSRNYRDGELKYHSGSIPTDAFLNPGDLLIACTDLTRERDIIGCPILVPDDGKKYTYSMDIAKISFPSTNIDDLYMFMTLRTEYYHDYIKAWASGTNVLHLNLEGLDWYSVCIPPVALQKEFANMIRNVHSKKSEALLENQQLASLRDFLLPMLMNGQVKVGKVGA